MRVPKKIIFLGKVIIYWSVAFAVCYGIAFNYWKGNVWTLEGECQVLYREIEEANRIINEYRWHELNEQN